jgi:Na+/melibiose symporter-like transporter
MKNDQWLILGVSIALIMFGGIVRNSVAAYYAKYYLHGGNELISPFLTTGVVASVMAMLLAGTITRYYDKIKMFRYTQLLTFVAGLPCTSSLASRTFIWHLFSFSSLRYWATCSFRCTGHQLRKQWTMVR